MTKILKIETKVIYGRDYAGREDQYYEALWEYIDAGWTKAVDVTTGSPTLNEDWALFYKETSI